MKLKRHRYINKPYYQQLSKEKDFLSAIRKDIKFWKKKDLDAPFVQEFLQKCIEAVANSDTFLACCHIGKLYMAVEDFVTAEFYLNHALTIAVEKKNTDEIITAHLNLGYLFAMFKFTEDAHAHLIEGVEMLDEKGEDYLSTEYFKPFKILFLNALWEGFLHEAKEYLYKVTELMDENYFDKEEWYGFMGDLVAVYFELSSMGLYEQANWLEKEIDDIKDLAFANDAEECGLDEAFLRSEIFEDAWKPYQIQSIETPQPYGIS